MASNLFAELSQDQLDFILNKFKNSKAEWNSLECPTKTLIDLNTEPVLDYFYMETSKVEEITPEKEHSFESEAKRS